MLCRALARALQILTRAALVEPNGQILDRRGSGVEEDSRQTVNTICVLRGKHQWAALKRDQSCLLLDTAGDAARRVAAAGERKGGSEQ